jgi:hypothetical protein
VLGIGVSAESQALRQEILSHVEPVSPVYRVDVPTRTGFLCWQLLLGQDGQLVRVDDNGYSLLGVYPVESEKARNCFQAVVQASTGDQEAQWLVHSLPLIRLDVCAADSPIARLQNHLLPGEHLTRVDLLVGLDTLGTAVETAKACLGQIQVEPAVVINTINVPFHLFDTQVVNHGGVPDITVWQHDWESNGLTLTPT